MAPSEWDVSVKQVVIFHIKLAKLFVVFEVVVQIGGLSSPDAVKLRVLIQVVVLVLVFQPVAIQIVPFLAFIVGNIDFDGVGADHFQLHAAIGTDDALTKSDAPTDIQFGVTFNAQS